MKTNGLSKLELSDLAHVTGGQIYEVWDEEEQEFCYLVPSATVYATYYNKTQAMAESGHLPRRDIITCPSWDTAMWYADSDCAYYHIINSYK